MRRVFFTGVTVGFALTFVVVVIGDRRVGAADPAGTVTAGVMAGLMFAAVATWLLWVAQSALDLVRALQRRGEPQ